MVADLCPLNIQEIYHIRGKANRSADVARKLHGSGRISMADGLFKDSGQENPSIPLLCE